MGLGVDFVLSLSQQEDPHQNLPEGNIQEVLDLAKSLTKPSQTHATKIFVNAPKHCRAKDFFRPEKCFGPKTYFGAEISQRGQGY